MRKKYPDPWKTKNTVMEFPWMSDGYGYMGYQNENIFITDGEKTYRIDPLNETLY